MEPALTEVEFSALERREPAEAPVGPVGAIVRIGSLTAWWASREAVRGAPIPKRGYLSEDHHDLVPREVPPTRGTVRQVEVVTTQFRRNRADDVTTSPVAGSSQLRSVRASPRQFQGFRHTVALDAAEREERGVLVGLEVPD